MVSVVPPMLDLPIRTERLLLRTPRGEDAVDLHRSLSDAAVCRYLRHEPYDLEDCQRLVDSWTFEGVVSRSWPRLVVEFEGAVVGYVSLNRHGSDTAEVGWMIDPAVQGRGLGREAASALLALGFTDLALHRIEARVDPRNAGSIRLCERLGLRREGHLRKVVKVGDERRDELVFAILLAEWSHG